MTSIRERKWKNKNGDPLRAFVVDYTLGGRRRIVTFPVVTQADAFKKAMDAALAVKVSPPKITPLRPNDLLWGIKAIADAIDRTPAATYHLARKGLLSARRVGKRYCADRNQLFASLTAPNTQQSRASAQGAQTIPDRD